ncbi:homocysteine S-methyltransferase (plasmid) [Paroceanicella profunda]|uniref:Homocysteine S-methyltransferase n=1 Tax=Paroceanicella profunda TaxID=2579971 RepID=A0A5B8FJK4_9RHOB|nr:homocysteine S-methyltransferase family protein [Paroceanicella profunda]QDL94418.1 homocysteine S-methyltransferase [Paroceanicella profunda]
MSRPFTRSPLPQTQGGLFLTDAGIETWLIFNRGVRLRSFAAFELLDSASGRAALRDYYLPFLELARSSGHGFVLETPTWRAGADWGAELGYSAAALTRLNREAVRFLAELARTAAPEVRVVLSGNIGPRGDGYDPGAPMTAAAAEEAHAFQVGVFATTEVEMISAATITSSAEAIGIARAAGTAGLPCAIGFTVETDGRLPSGEGLIAAIRAVDAACPVPPAYYMINCAHPDHFAGVLAQAGETAQRIRSLRANASRMSHAELDGAETLDAGDREELAQLYAGLMRQLPALSVVGGCCGTDHGHVREIARACGGIAHAAG